MRGALYRVPVTWRDAGSGTASLAWPSCRGGGQVGGLACGVPVGVDSDDAEIGAIEGLGVCGCLLGDPGQVICWLSA